jgi:phosphate:Na+ symporter
MPKGLRGSSTTGASKLTTSSPPRPIETSSLHLDVLRDLSRIHSHLVSVAYPLLEASGDLRESRLAPERQARKTRAKPAEGTF